MINANQIFRCITGSQSYGTSLPTSDIDYKGVYIQHQDEILSFRYKEQIENGNDDSSFEVRRFLQLLLSANPTVLEMLFMPQDCVLLMKPQFELIVAYKDRFLTKKCCDSFGGYAVAQIRKAKGLDKKMNWEQSRIERKELLDFCYVITPLGTVEYKDWLLRQKVGESKPDHYCLAKIDHARDAYFLYWVEDHHGGFATEKSNDVRVDSIPKGIYPKGTLLFNKDAHSIHCKDYLSYKDWMKNRNTQRFVDVRGHDQMIDGKNLLHCRRLLDTCIEIARDKTINVRRPNAEELLKIRRGEVDLQAIIDQAEKDIKGLDELFDNSGLPDSVDMDFVNDLLLKVRYYAD